MPLSADTVRRRRLRAASAGALLVLGALLARPSPAFPQADPAREVEQLERSLVAAIGTGDLATYDRIVADDYVVVGLNGTETTKAQVMAQYRSGERGYVNLQISEVRGHVFGDTAVVAARTTGSRVEDGRQIPNNVRYIRVFARRDGTWRAVLQMSAPIPAS